ncbi:hypothetical protein ACT17_14860 [Mycolicibacterium conceptionense]|uniref:Trypsin domain-containing protein n=1 Tax=Mycolicibacterium conceptionense TaxID=451644 RepID=A0A0J8WXD4_9MYCO|nr:hypothetical protein ACT17_14860 [Mycolicibacterium conceptionense]
MAGGDVTAGPAAATSTTASVSPTARTWVTIPDNILASAPKRATLVQRLADGTERCTAGPAVAPAASPRTRGYLTAGHCDKAPGAPVSIAGGGSGTYTGTTTTDPYGVTTLWGTPSTATVAGGQYKVAGVLTKDAVKKLPGDTPVCIDGMVSGLHCGTLLDADEDGIEVEKTRTRPGDSGAPVFLLDAATQTATLIGIHDATSGEFAYVTYLDRALAQTNSKVLVDPQAQAAVAGDTGYSSETTAATAQ